MLRRPLAIGLATAAVALAACGEKEEPEISAPLTPPPEQGSGGERERASGEGGVRLEQIGKFDQPVYVAQPPGERDLYVVEQPGRVMRLPAGGGPPTTFLDLSREVSCCGEQGLLSVAFAPDYPRSGRFYVDYTNKAGDTRVVEYRRRDGRAQADPQSARRVLAVDQPFQNHNGGLLLFDSAGNLYVGLGDGGAAGDPDRNAQDLGEPLGKILRIDPARGARYAIPASNPFRDRPGASPELFSYGLRNPWRFSFDRHTGDLWIGDVGQNELEEINGVTREQAAGGNFGWSAFEGTERFNEDQEAPGAIPPVLEYGRDRGCSVTGGYVVRDRSLPTLFGRYLYGDFCQGELRSFTAKPGRAATDDVPLGLQVPSLSSFGEDRRGRIYALSLEGPVYRLAPD